MLKSLNIFENKMNHKINFFSVINRHYYMDQLYKMSDL